MGSEKNPVEEYLQEKTAGPFSGLGSGFRQGFVGQGASVLGKDIGSAVRSGLLGGVGSLAVGALGMGAQRLYDAATKANDFRAMLEANPHLVPKQQEDPKRFNQIFTTLRTFNPGFSKDPLVAGSMVEHMLDNQTGISGLMGEALKSRDSLRNPLFDQVPRAILESGKKQDEKKGPRRAVFTARNFRKKPQEE